MSITALVWVALAGFLFLMSFRRPVWAVALYLQTFFAAPQLWWWGRDLPPLRYALWAGVFLLACVAVYYSMAPGDAGHRKMGSHKAVIVMVANATVVHLLFAVDRTISLDTYVELLKYGLLFYLMWLSIRDKRDLGIVLMTIALGGLYIGWEITINERGNFNGSRLEDVGAPAADNSNSLANLLLTMLPLIASLLVWGSWRNKIIALVSAPLVLNVVLLCNSRGAFLGLIGAALGFLVLARGATRKRALASIAVGGVALFLLLGDPKILDRFSTTFVGSEERDNSAASRLDFWKAGGLQLQDYPFGAGGGSFKFSIGRRYLTRVIGEDAVDRSLHNGFLTEATDWGIQGIIIKLCFIGFGLLATYRTLERCRRAGQNREALLGLCIISSMIAFLISTLFGSFLANEWTYWIVALMVRYSELYSADVVAATTTTAASQAA